MPSACLHLEMNLVYRVFSLSVMGLWLLCGFLGFSKSLRQTEIIVFLYLGDKVPEVEHLNYRIFFSLFLRLLHSSPTLAPIFLSCIRSLYLPLLLPLSCCCRIIPNTTHSTVPEHIFEAIKPGTSLEPSLTPEDRGEGDMEMSAPESGVYRVSRSPVSKVPRQ